MFPNGCKWVWETNKDFEFGGAVNSWVRQQLSKIDFMPWNSMPQRNQYRNWWSKMWCTVVNPIRLIFWMYGFHVSDSIMQEVIEYAVANHEHSYEEGNWMSKWILASVDWFNGVYLPRIGQPLLELVYYNIWFNSEDHHYVNSLWYGTIVWHKVTKKRKADRLDNNRLDTYDRWPRQTGHITLMTDRNTIRDSNYWTPYEIYETPIHLYKYWEEYRDFYNSNYIFVPIRTIYKMDARRVRMYEAMLKMINNDIKKAQSEEEKEYIKNEIAKPILDLLAKYSHGE